MTSTETGRQMPTLGRLARRTITTIMGAFQNRVELFTLEFEEENERLLKMVICAVGGAFLAMMALLLITGVVIYITPEPYRIYSALGFAALYIIGAVAAVFTIKKLIVVTPFAESLKQFRKDSELLEAFK